MSRYLAKYQDPDGRRNNGFPTFAWRCAPEGLATRHQLSRLGLRPAGQQTVGLHVAAWALGVGLVVDGASHYWADRRSTLLWLAAAMDKIGPFGKADFYRLGAPRPGRDDNPSMGTGAAALDQSWHMVWLFIAALLAAAL